MKKQNNKNAPEGLLTKKEAAEYLRITTRTLDNYIKAGTIKPIIIGTLKRFPKDVLSTVK